MNRAQLLYSTLIITNTHEIKDTFLGGLSLHLKPPYSIARGKLRLAIWYTSFWTFWLKFGHKGP